MRFCETIVASKKNHGNEVKTETSSNTESEQIKIANPLLFCVELLELVELGLAQPHCF